MIFVTVGTQLPFSRLLRGVDAWAAENPDMEVRAQTGKIPATGYHPRHMTVTQSLEAEAFDQLCQSARLIVAHAGTGSLLKANLCGTPLLMMPRRGALNEHRNDHQMATAERFSDRPGVRVVYEEDEIAPAITDLLARDPQPPRLNEAADEDLIATMRGLIFQ